MRLFLVRHGETVDNVAGLYAGVTDSALTNHGALQASRLGAHLAATDSRISHIFSSDLSRAYKTAEAIRLAQPKPSEADGQTISAKETIQLKLLREQDFGSLERKSWSERSFRSHSLRENEYVPSTFRDSDFKNVESKESMNDRADTFIDEHLIPLLVIAKEDHAVVVVAHGVILAHLWQSTKKCFPQANLSAAPGVGTTARGFSLDSLGVFANTGYLEVEIRHKIKPDVGSYIKTMATVAVPQAIQTGPGSAKSVEPASTKQPEGIIPALPSERKLLDMLVTVKAINSIEHLKNLKKTRCGIGSSVHDEDQKSIETFFKKRKIS